MFCDDFETMSFAKTYLKAQKSSMKITNSIWKKF